MPSPELTAEGEAHGIEGSVALVAQVLGGLDHAAREVTVVDLAPPLDRLLAWPDATAQRTVVALHHHNPARQAQAPPAAAAAVGPSRVQDN